MANRVIQSRNSRVKNWWMWIRSRKRTTTRWNSRKQMILHMMICQMMNRKECQDARK